MDTSNFCKKADRKVSELAGVFSFPWLSKRKKIFECLLHLRI